MKKVLVFCEVRSKNELIPTVCHTILINRPVSEVIPFPISRELPRREAADMGSATRYTPRRNTASIMKI